MVQVLLLTTAFGVMLLTQSVESQLNSPLHWGHYIYVVCQAD